MLFRSGSEVNTTGYSGAFEVYGLATTSLPWQYGIRMRPGASVEGIVLEQDTWITGSSTNVGSQPVKFVSTNSIGEEVKSQIYSDTNGALTLQSNRNQINIPYQQVLTINGATITSASIAACQFENLQDTIALYRATDSGPNGYFARFQNLNILMYAVDKLSVFLKTIFTFFY